MQGRVGYLLVAFSTVSGRRKQINPATRENEGNANAPVLYIAIELSNKNVRVLSYSSYDGDNNKLNLIIKST